VWVGVVGARQERSGKCAGGGGPPGAEGKGGGKDRAEGGTSEEGPDEGKLNGCIMH